MLSLDIFGTQALWSPYFFVSLLILTAGYFLITGKYRSIFKDSEPLSISQSILFIVGMVLIYIIKGSPLDLMGHLMFYAHMIQMAVLYLVIPPLFVIAIPDWLWRSVLRVPIVKSVFPFMTKPLIALILFNGLFSFYHIPLIFDAVKQNMLLHASFTTLLFIMALMMWWPLLNNLPEYRSLSGLKKVGYVFANGILLTPACALIIFADSPMYATFSDPNSWAKAMELCVSPSTLAGLNLSGPEMFNSMSLQEDQRLGGVLMKIIQEIVYGVILAKVFFEWYREEQTRTDLQPEPYRGE